GSDGAAGFGDKMSGPDQLAHGLTDLIFAHRHDVVHEPADMSKRDFANRRGAQAIGDGAQHLLGGEGDALAGAQAGLGVGRQLGLNPNDLYRGLGLLDGGGDAADQSAAADRREDQFEIG